MTTELSAHVGYLQFFPEFGAKERNLATICSALAQAAADLIVLPELPFTGYSFADREQLADLADDPSKSPILETLIALCQERDFYLVTGFAEESAGRLFNSSLLLGPEGLLRTYRKLHLFGNEKRYFDAGDLPLSVDEVRGMRIGMQVCFDWAFPEMARSLALLGADIVCQPANLVLPHCQSAMLIRSLENGIFCVTANRIGSEGDMHYTGGSQICAPGGKLVRQAPRDRSELHVANLDLKLARNKSLTASNDLLGDRRPDFYFQTP